MISADAHLALRACSWDACVKHGIILRLGLRASACLQGRLRNAWTQWKVDAAERHQKSLLEQEEVCRAALTMPAPCASVSATAQQTEKKEER